MKSAVLLSDSHIWGIWCYHALRKTQISFELILAEELDENLITRYKALFVPGGWSKNKLDALGERGKRLIRAFVETGGIYIGICGGASLAGLEGLSIAPVRRRKERVPSYSGPCRVNFTSRTHLLDGIGEPTFYLWFPPEIEPINSEVEIIATFDSPHPDAYTSDLCLKDHGEDLAHFEKLYNIFLHPNRMKNKPLLFEYTSGKGKVFLSLIHFDTPSCESGLRFLQNLARHYELPQITTVATHNVNSTLSCSSLGLLSMVSRMRESVYALLEFGMRNFLFHRRYPFFVQWKRGIRGLELLNLIYMIEELYALTQFGGLTSETMERAGEILSRVERDLTVVLEVLKRSYRLRRMKVGDRELDLEESIVFGNNLKSYGGLYRELVNNLERVLCYLWREKTC